MMMHLVSSKMYSSIKRYSLYLYKFQNYLEQTRSRSNSVQVCNLTSVDHNVGKDSAKKVSFNSSTWLHGVNGRGCPDGSEAECVPGLANPSDKLSVPSVHFIKSGDHSASFTSVVTIGSCGSLLDFDCGIDERNKQITDSTNPHVTSQYINDVDLEDTDTDDEDGCCTENLRNVRKCQGCLIDCGGRLRGCVGTHNYKQIMKRRCNLEAVRDKFPITRWLPKYRLIDLQGDIVSGLTVGLMILSQGLSYAKIVQIPTQYGLYSCFMGCFSYIIFGTAKDVSIGPSSVTSLLTSQFTESPVPDDVSYVVFLCFMCGVIQFTLAVCNLGFVVDYISQPVIIGFTQAAVLTTITGQIPNWLGLKGIPKDFLHQIYWTLRRIPETNPWDFLMGVCCLAFLLILKKIKLLRCLRRKASTKSRRILKYLIWVVTTSRSAFVIIAAGGAVAIFIAFDLNPFSRSEQIPDGLPPFRPPPFSVSVGNETLDAVDMFRSIGVGLFIVPLISLLETVAIGKAFARKNGYKINPNQELLALGVGNILGSFVSAFPVSSSFSRSSMNEQSGSRTPLTGLCTGIIALLALAFLTPILQYVPDAALGAIIISSSVDMISISNIIDVYYIKKMDLIPLFITFILSMLLGLQYGILVGIGLSLCILLYPTSKPKIDCHLIANCIHLTPNQGLTFPCVEHFKTRISAAISMATDGLELKYPVVMDMCHVSEVDYTTVQGIMQLVVDYLAEKRSFIVCRIRPRILKILNRAQNKHFRYTSSLEDALLLAHSREFQNKAKSDAEVSYNKTSVFTIAYAEDDEEKEEDLEVQRDREEISLDMDSDSLSKAHSICTRLTEDDDASRSDLNAKQDGVVLPVIRYEKRMTRSASSDSLSERVRIDLKLGSKPTEDSNLPINRRFSEIVLEANVSEMHNEDEKSHTRSPLQFHDRSRYSNADLLWVEADFSDSSSNADGGENINSKIKISQVTVDIGQDNCTPSTEKFTARPGQISDIESGSVLGSYARGLTINPWKSTVRSYSYELPHQEQYGKFITERYIYNGTVQNSMLSHYKQSNSDINK